MTRIVPMRSFRNRETRAFWLGLHPPHFFPLAKFRRNFALVSVLRVFSLPARRPRPARNLEKLIELDLVRWDRVLVRGKVRVFRVGE
jgi:hypothetical protein